MHEHFYDKQSIPIGSVVMECSCFITVSNPSASHSAFQEPVPNIFLGTACTQNMNGITSFFLFVLFTFSVSIHLHLYLLISK